MELAAVLIAGAALLVSLVGTWLSNKRALASQRLAREALSDAQSARGQALWAQALEAAQRMVGLDPTTTDAREPFVRLRVSLTALVDELDDWEGFDRWLAVEHVFGAALGRQVLESHDPTHGIEEHLEVLRPLHEWATVLTQNLRRFRKVGYDAAQVADLERTHADVLWNLYKRRGWGEPDVEMPS